MNPVSEEEYQHNPQLKEQAIEQQQTEYPKETQKLSGRQIHSFTYDDSNRNPQHSKTIQPQSPTQQQYSRSLRQQSRTPTKELNKKNLETICRTKDKLDCLIEELNQKLVNHFQHKEEELLNSYRQKLLNAQKELTELKSFTNQEQIRTKMVERKRQLERERHELIETNLFYSNKCQQYKKKLSNLLNEGKELEREIQFLEGQLEAANRKKVQAESKYRERQVKQLTPMESKSKQQGETAQKTASKSVIPSKESSLKKRLLNNAYNQDTQQMLQRISSYKKKKSGKPTGSQSRYEEAYDRLKVKSTLEGTFQEAVDKVRSKRKGKRAIPLPKGEEFTDLQKRAIMQDFLSNEYVKKRIYEIIFDSNDLEGMPDTAGMKC